MSQMKMSNSIFDQIKLLYEQELFSTVVSLVNFVITMTDHNPQLLSPADKFMVYIYYGNSLFQMGLYRRAEAIYRHALQFKKSVFKTKQATKPNEVSKDLVSDVDIKYKMHLCYVKLNQSEDAISILQSVSAKQRTAKVNLALAKLFQQSGMERSAITAYKEVLKECPMAMEAIEGLLSLGVSGVEVHTLIIDANVVGMEWLNCWIKAHANIHSRDYSQAIISFKQLEDRSPIRGNHTLLAWLGETYYYSGDSQMATIMLQRAQMADPNNQRGIDILAALLANEKRVTDIERLIPSTWTHEEHGPRAWTALAYILYVNKNLSRAVYLAQKACCSTPRNVEAFILKGKILFDMKKYIDAVLPFREALKLAPYRYEPHQGLVDCYVITHRLREASTIASNACKQLNNAPRALTLYASVLMKDPVAVSKAKSLLEKALNSYDTYLPAVYLLAEILEQEMNLEGAVSLLEKHVQVNPTCRLHQMLGDLLGRLNEETKAFDHYHSALRLEPNNPRVLEGMNRLDGVGGNAGRETSYYNASSDVDTSFVDNNPPSDHEDSSELST